MLYLIQFRFKAVYSKEQGVVLQALAVLVITVPEILLRDELSLPQPLTAIPPSVTRLLYSSEASPLPGDQSCLVWCSHSPAGWVSGLTLMGVSLNDIMPHTSP